jgi:serine/threonine-protein kinase
VRALAARLLRPAPSPDAPPQQVARLAKAERMIDLGWSVASLWGVLRIVAALWLLRGSGGYEAAWFIDPALILLLAYGLYRRSRVCAALLLVYVVVELWLAFHAAGRPTGLGVALLLEVSFLTGLRGTLLYHREMETAPPG